MNIYLFFYTLHSVKGENAKYALYFLLHKLNIAGNYLALAKSFLNIINKCYLCAQNKILYLRYVVL